MSLVIAVCFKITPDVKVLAADPLTGAPQLSRCPRRISDLDEHAIEAAVQLKERGGGEVVGLTVCVGPPPREVELRALAMGLDRLCVKVLDKPPDPRATADLLTEMARGVPQLDLVLFGEGSVDGYRGQAAPRVAEALGWASVAGVVRIEAHGRELELDRQLEDCVETWRLDLPVVLSVGAEINQPRLPSVMHVMAAGRKPVLTMTGEAGDGLQRTVDLHGVRTERRCVPIQGDSPRDTARRLLHALAEEGEVRL